MMCLDFANEIVFIQFLYYQLVVIVTIDLEFELYFSWLGLMYTMVLRDNNLSELQGGMSNELYNTIARVTDGIYEGTTEFVC